MNDPTNNNCTLFSYCTHSAFRRKIPSELVSGVWEGYGASAASPTSAHTGVESTKPGRSVVVAVHGGA